MNEKLIKDFINAVKSEKKKPSPYDTSAKVVRVDGDTAWVHIAGGVDETPAKMTTSAKVGDEVQVRVSGGRAFIIGNATSPPTDDTQANKATKKAEDAQEKASNAIDYAEIAKTASDEAKTYASEAKETTDIINGYAEEVDKSVKQILIDGETAGVAAQEAKASAENASEYAARALGNLSTVQNVTETLNWITQHGTMALTSDVDLDPTHVYFVRDANGDYHVGSYYYSVVTEPDVDDIGTYYELSIDESLNNYVGTHLALTSEGLWLLPASSGTNKVLIATGAGSIYTTAGTYIIDSSGKTVAMFGENMTIGITDGTQNYLYEDFHSLQLIDKGGNTYFYVSDLRDVTGKTPWTDTFTGNGTSKTFNLNLPATDTSYTVSVSDSSGGAVSKSTTAITFSSAPTNGATITATYQTADYHAKAYTLGFRAGVTAPMSVAEGNNITASGYTSHAEGTSTTASGGYSHAEGRSTTASGQSSHAEGYVTTSSGTYAHAEGANTIASGDISHAEGSNTTASGRASHAEGDDTTASAGISHAEGYLTTASAHYSHAQNRGTIAASSDQTALGKFNISDTQNKYAVIVGNGSWTDNRSDALTVDWHGNITLALDTTAASGTDHDLYAAITALGWENDVIV